MTTFTSGIKKYPGKNIELPIILLSACCSQRMTFLGSKFLYKTSNAPLGMRQIYMLENEFEMGDIILGIGNDSKKILKMISSVKTVENTIWEQTCELETLRLCLNIVPDAERVLIIDGDVLFHVNGFDFITYGKSSVLYFDDDNGYGININTHVSGVDKEFPNKITGVLYLEKNELDIARKYANNQSTRYDMHDLIAHLARNGKLFAHKCDFFKANSARKVEVLQTI